MSYVIHGNPFGPQRSTFFALVLGVLFLTAVLKYYILCTDEIYIILQLFLFIFIISRHAKLTKQNVECFSVMIFQILLRAIVACP